MNYTVMIRHFKENYKHYCNSAINNNLKMFYQTFHCLLTVKLIRNVLFINDVIIKCYLY